MLGILSRPLPCGAASATAVLIVAGGAQYRVGSHRQFVSLARRLARAGHAALRFDLTGMGDSPGEPVSFEAGGPAIAAALDALFAHQPGLQRAVLWGLCDGASASLLYVQATQDPRVAGLALLNPWVRHDASLARAQVKHYYRQRLRQAAFWRKLLRCAVGWGALRELGQQLWRLAQHRRSASTGSTPDERPFQDRMALGWHRFPGALLLLLSECDLTAQEFVEHARSDPAWAGWDQRPGALTHTLAQADHTCSDPASARQLETLVLTWLRGLD
jgi:exosortase A-associated hydrolase 1